MSHQRGNECLGFLSARNILTGGFLMHKWRVRNFSFFAFIQLGVSKQEKYARNCNTLQCVRNFKGCHVVKAAVNVSFLCTTYHVHLETRLLDFCAQRNSHYIALFTAESVKFQNRAHFCGRLPRVYLQWIMGQVLTNVSLTGAAAMGSHRLSRRRMWTVRSFAFACEFKRPWGTTQPKHSSAFCAICFHSDTNGLVPILIPCCTMTPFARESWSVALLQFWEHA